MFLAIIMFTLMLKLCVILYFIAPPNTPNRSCNIISTSLSTVTTPGGVIPSGTQNVTLYCVCRSDNFIAVGPTEWFINGTEVNRTENNGSGEPYFRNNVPSPFIIPSFVTGNSGTYRCGSSPANTISTSDDTITLLGTYVCNYVL